MSKFIDWGAFTPESVAEALPRLLKEAESSVSALESSSGATYEDFVWALDDATRGLRRTWRFVCHMQGVMNSPEWRKVEEEFQPKVIEFSLRVSQSRALYDRARSVRAALPAGASVQARILDKMVQSAELAGVGLDDERRIRFNEIQARLAQLAMEFSNAVIDATAAFSYEKDGKTYTIDDAAYIETMKECADREVRERLCRARATRALENSERIAEILKLRREKASILGFGDYADLSLATKCAPSVAAVMKMVDDLDSATAEIAERERLELESVQDEGAGEVQPWDGAFLAERLRIRKYSYSEEELKRHFEFSDVLKGLFRMTEFLFGVHVEEIVGDAKPSVWHPDVRFFSVKDGGVVIAHFYLDPYVRTGLKGGGAWMNDLEDRIDRLGQKPLALISTNFKAPDAEGKTYLPMRDVETLFHEFGHALQCMLTEVGEEGASGVNLVEWDAVEIASQFMENWCLDDRTGISVPEDLKAKVKASKNFRAATTCRRQLAFTKTDMLLHGKDDVPDANEVKREVFAHFGTPIVPEDQMLCSFGHIFAGGYAAGYYGYKWSEVMSADCYGAFEEAGLGDDVAMKRIGARYRETLLGMGGSENALDVFRMFRGRDPEISALLRQQGLLA